MEPVIVRGLAIGEGMPKICVPIAAQSKSAVLSEARELQNMPADLAEWRADWQEGVFQEGNVREMLHELRAILGEMPLLFTFRTAQEGGEQDIDTETYVKLNIEAIQSGHVDLVDVQAFLGEAPAKELIHEAHRHGVKVIASYHDFEQTPAQGEIVSRLIKMQEMGADIAKIAVMPKDARDVLTLLAATEEMRRAYAKGPIVTMSMSKCGVISRISGEAFGSAITFAAGNKASAPGQIDAVSLSRALEAIHGSPDAELQ